MSREGEPSGSGGNVSDPAPPAQVQGTPLFTSNIPVPPKLEVTGNLEKNWKRWKQTWDAYETVTGLASREDKLRVAAFITCIGPNALEVHAGLPFESEEDKSSITAVMRKWEEYCVGKTNIIYEDTNSITALKKTENPLITTH